MPKLVTFEDGTTALEFSPQELDEHNMNVFLKESVRWRNEQKAVESPEFVMPHPRKAKYSDSRTPNKYKIQ